MSLVVRYLWELVSCAVSKALQLRRQLRHRPPWIVAKDALCQWALKLNVNLGLEVIHPLPKIRLPAG
jgi:hypothetical protein